MRHVKPSQWKLAAGIAVIFSISFIVYIPALNAGFIWDDDDYVTNNNAIRTMAGLTDVWFKLGTTPQYYPLVFTTFSIEYRLWGLNPIGYHAINIALHSLAAVLLWRVLTRLGIQAGPAWVAAIVFAVHPIQVESVAWITERKNVLSAAWYLLAVLAYLRFARLGTFKEISHQWSFYALALGCFGLALLSKTVACTLPATILVLTWWKRGRVSWNDVRPTIPFFVIGIGMGLLTAWMEKHSVGVRESDYGYTALERVFIAGRVVWFYVSKTVWPTHLAFVYPPWIVNDHTWRPFVFPLAAIGVIICFWCLRSRIGRGPLAAILIYGGTLFPALGFVDVYPFRFSIVADHFQYLASMALMALLVIGAANLLGRLGTTGIRLAVITAVLVVAALAALAHRQCAVYHNLETLWRDTINKNPQAWLAHHNLGVVLRDQGRIDEAIPLFEAAILHKPDYDEAHYNLGNLLADRRQLDQAIEHYRQALAANPLRSDATFNLGNALRDQGKPDEALSQYKRVLELAPRHSGAAVNAGAICFQQGRLDDALRLFRRAVEIDPGSAQAHINVGLVLTEQRNINAAAAEFREALRLNLTAGESVMRLGYTLASQDRLDEAVSCFDIVLEFSPRDVPARKAREAALEQKARTGSKP